MIDHFFADLIAQVRQSLDGALLERQAVEERFQVDVFLGDLSWETSYSLPGEEQPPRVRADLSLDWPTWSQTAYRSWSIGEAPEEPPEVVLEVALRIQRLAKEPDAAAILQALPSGGPTLNSEALVRSAVTIEQVHGQPTVLGEPEDGVVRWAVEATYEGSLQFPEEQLNKPSDVAPMAGALARWVASSLVRLADLPLAFLPPEPDQDE